jgi:polar amino acid transport system substrate-binding protein
MQPQRPEGPISARSRQWRPTRAGLATATTAVIAAAALAACGSSSSGGGSASTTSGSSGSGSSTAAATGSSTSAGGSGTSTSSGAAKSVTIDGQKIAVDPKLAAMVPAKVKSAGLTDITYNNAPPDEQVVNGKNVGWEIDLGQAVAATLGVPWNLTTSGNFDSFIPGLQNGRYNTSFTSFIQTPARLKQIDIVTYYNVGTGFAVKKGTALTIKQPADLCGHSVAVLEGSAFIQQIKSIKCGSKPINVQTFPSDSAAELAVSSGRDEVYSSSSDQLSYLIQQTEHQFVLQPLDFLPTPEGAGLTKGLGLTTPVADAMNDLIKSGAYTAIMKKWSITQGLVKKATVYSKH